jgi:hypothetical protein
MQGAVTVAAQNDEVLFAICSRLASADHVMELQLIAPAALLTLPAIPLENLQAEPAVTLEIEPNPPASGNLPTHADRLMSRKNCC